MGYGVHSTTRRGEPGDPVRRVAKATGSTSGTVEENQCRLYKRPPETPETPDHQPTESQTKEWLMSVTYNRLKLFCWTRTVNSLPSELLVVVYTSLWTSGAAQSLMSEGSVTVCRTGTEGLKD